MWLFFPFAFVSVVHKPGDAPGVLCVRARDEKSLDAVRERCPELGPTIAGGGTDYPLRAYVDAAAFGAFVGAYIGQIDFNNFKAETTRQHGQDYHDACMTVWGTMHRLSQRPLFSRNAPAWRRNDGGMPGEDFFGPARGSLPVVYRRGPRR